MIIYVHVHVHVCLTLGSWIVHVHVHTCNTNINTESSHISLYSISLYLPNKLKYSDYINLHIRTLLFM